MLFLCNIFSRTIVDSAAFWKLVCCEVSLGAIVMHSINILLAPYPSPHLDLILPQDYVPLHQQLYYYIDYGQLKKSFKSQFANIAQS